MIFIAKHLIFLKTRVNYANKTTCMMLITTYVLANNLVYNTALIMIKIIYVLNASHIMPLFKVLVFLFKLLSKLTSVYSILKSLLCLIKYALNVRKTS